MNRRFLTLLLLPLAMIGGGTALAASNAPGSGAHAPLVHPKSVVRVAIEGLAPIELRHLQNAPSTPAPTPSPSAAATQPLAPAPTSSPASPSHTSAPAPKPRPTAPPPVVVVPPPTPAPTPYDPIQTSGTLPPIAMTIQEGGSTVANLNTDSYSNTFTCPQAATNCIPSVEVNIPQWGNYDLLVKIAMTTVTYLSPQISDTLTITNEVTGYGAHSGTGGYVGVMDASYSVEMTITVGWAES